MNFADIPVQSLELAAILAASPSSHCGAKKRVVSQIYENTRHKVRMREATLEDGHEAEKYVAVISVAETLPALQRIRPAVGARAAAIADAVMVLLAPRFDAIDRKFDAIDRRFDAIDRRFDSIDRRFDSIEGRFDREVCGQFSLNIVY